MYPELTNLLPEERVRRLRRDYFVRLALVVEVLGILLVVSMAIVLTPTYRFLQKQVHTKQEQLTALEARLATSDEVRLEARLKALSANAALLALLGSAPTRSEVIESLLALPSPGITLSGFSFSAGKGTTQGTLAITGTANTRDRLRAYQLTLLEAPFVQSADLPISAYAKDTAIDFTITIVLAPPV